MNTNDHKMLEQPFTTLATKQKGRVDIKPRQLASQQNALTPLCGVRQQHFPRGILYIFSLSFYLGNDEEWIGAKLEGLDHWRETEQI